MADMKTNAKSTAKAGPRRKAAAKKAVAPARAGRAGGRKPAPEATGGVGLRTKSGAVLTPEAEAALLAEAEAGYDPEKLVPRKVAGRPSLSAGGGTSHRINVRVEDEIYDVLQRVARDSGRRPSELVREVLRAAYGPKS
jgi:hypothetical protein